MSFQKPDDKNHAQVMMFPADTWKREDGARAAFGTAATWTDADVDRAAAADGELGVFNGIRCVVLRTGGG